MLFKRLLHLLEVLKQPDVVGEFGRALRDAGQHRQVHPVELARIGLAGHRKAAAVSHLFRDAPVERAAFFVVPLKQLEERRLGAGGALGAEQLRLRQAVAHLLEIHQKFLDPQRRALADGGRLRGLEVGEREGGEILVFLRKTAQLRDGVDQLFLHQPHRVVEDNQVGVVADIAARRPQMDDTAGVRALLAIGIDMRHHIVADFLFPLRGDFIVNVLRMGLQLRDLLVGNRQAELLLGLRERDPQLPPGAELIVGGEQVLHLPAGIARGQGRFIFIRHS